MHYSFPCYLNTVLSHHSPLHRCILLNNFYVKIEGLVLSAKIKQGNTLAAEWSLVRCGPVLTGEGTRLEHDIWVFHVPFGVSPKFLGLS